MGKRPALDRGQGHVYFVKIVFDPAKREWTLDRRFLDFADAEEVFSGVQFTYEEVRRDYHEQRFVAAGLLRGRMVVIVWTERVQDGEPVRHVVSMRKADGRGKARFENELR